MKHTKHLRREAESMSVGAPYAAYTGGRSGGAELTPRCTKGIYKRLKREEASARYAIMYDDEWFAGWTREGAKFVPSPDGVKKYDTFRAAMIEMNADPRFSKARVVKL